MNVAIAAKRFCKRIWPIIRIIPRLLLGLALLCTLIPLGILLVSEGLDWSDVQEFMEEFRNFFGNWTAPGLLLAFVTAIPLLGTCLILQACASLWRL